MKIAFITDRYTPSMGYLENCLPKELAALGHEVHVLSARRTISSDQAYGNAYSNFSNTTDLAEDITTIDGYTLHLLPWQSIGRYILIRGLVRKLRQLQPDVIQVNAAASPNLYSLTAGRFFYRGRVFSACHQCSSVLHPTLKSARRVTFGKIVYFATRTLPGWLCSFGTEKCFAPTPDCAEVAIRCYGVPRKKIVLLPLGTDTEQFRPVMSTADHEDRKVIRASLGFAEEEIVCIYTGRFTCGKNPRILARAVESLRARGLPYRGLFIGDGEQKDDITSCAGCIVKPFVKYKDLPQLYRASDIGVWPTQESMSMLDAAASGLPIVVSDRMGDMDRVEGNGLVFSEGSVEDLARALHDLKSKDRRKQLGDAGRCKVEAKLSWKALAQMRIRQY